MSWKIEVKPTAEKNYRKLDKNTRDRIKAALKKLQEVDDPLKQQSVGALTGQLKGDYRLRIGDWRVLFTPDRKRKILNVYAILPRSKAYK